MPCIEDAIYERNRTSGPIDTFTTSRGTHVEFFEDSEFGFVCIMDGKIQSATADEAIYHKYLASLGLSYGKTPQRVLIVGSGEGCLAREVLRLPDISEVVMIDWDEDVVNRFRTRWNVWAGGNKTWEDPRLKIEIADIWEMLNRVDAVNMWKFDYILVDLFDPGRSPKEIELWETLMRGLAEWVSPGGTLAAYCGMFGEDIAEETLAYLSGGGYWRTSIPIRLNNEDGANKDGILGNLSTSKIHVPSFGGDAVFIRGYKPEVTSEMKTIV
ncbi:MAG: hypothetical protein EBT86_01050 [Actinobacteria bacterium]|nr:hypothetical protein [Actinomycetota bacterium]